MNIQEKRKAFEKLLTGAPKVMSPMQAPEWTPYGRKWANITEKPQLK